MKQILFLMGIVFLIASCSAPKGVINVKSTNEENIAEDSIEYELETFDGRFEAWYQLYNNPANYRSLQYYENWNRQYVSAWNFKAMNGSRNSFFEPIVGYDETEDYGFELNHELFYYFQYVERVLNIQIMEGGPQVMVF